MSTQGFEPPAAGETVRAALAAADRRRRAREASRLLWRAAPVVAGLALAAAIARRWTGWSAWTPAMVLLVAAAAILVYLTLATRRRTLDDAAAAAIDAHAGLGGELRSASWFAAQSPRDAWADHHLQKAAARLAAIDWSELYPAARAPRARLASAVMVAGALILTFSLPQRAAARRPASPEVQGVKVPPLTDARGEEILVPPELMAQLQALLAAAQKGDIAEAERLASSDELRELLNKLAADPDLLAKLAKALAATDPTKGPTASELKALADRARKAAETAAMSQDMREALEKMAEQAEAHESAGNEDGEAMESDGPQKGDPSQGNTASSMQDLSVQMARQADAEGGAGLMMMSAPQDSSSGPPGSGVGGSASEEAAAAAAAALAAAFKQEVVEASADNAGDNIEAEVRRKSEQGDATTGFTNAAAGQFDKSRAAGPPPVPEARRTGVQNYFVRKPQ